MHTVGFIKIVTIKGSILQEEGDFVASFGVNNTPIYMSQCSFIIRGGLLETGSSPDGMKM